MRRIERKGLTQAVASRLQGFQANANVRQAAGTLNVTQHWDARRQSKAILKTLATLQAMSGPRQRCMYCVDSLATDIEHFWPKNPYPSSMYVWPNLLVACTQCGRFKGDAFPLNAAGLPLLIDPSAEDPWESLDFDPGTGNLSARFLLGMGQYSPKGEETVRLLHLDRREGISAGYRKTYRRLCALVVPWADDQVPNDYLEQLSEADDHGILGWFMRPPGENEPAFQDFRHRHPNEWHQCQTIFA